MALNLMPHGTQKVEKLFIKLITAALLLKYAYPALGFRRKLAVLAVAMTWLFPPA
jgi:hypothetical protein